MVSEDSQVNIRAQGKMFNLILLYGHDQDR